MKTVAFIFARGGSKGLPGKNLRLLCGKPLIAYSIEQALQVHRIDRVIVSTDSQEIASTSLEFGAEVPFVRPSELASDDAPEWFSWKHGLEYLKTTSGGLPDAMVSLPATAPLRLPEDIEKCLDEFQSSTPDVVVTVTPSQRNPYFNMVKDNLDGSVSLVNSSPEVIHTRQNAPRLFDMTTVCYVANPEFILRNDSIFEGLVRKVIVPIERAIDIDTLLDFEIAEFLLKKNTSCP